MIPKEAIEVLRKNKPTYDPRECGKELCEACDVAIEALEKQIPKKPKYKEFGASKYWDCPVCGEVVLSHIDGIPLKNEYNHSHCGGCGQAIDWSEE